MRTESINTIGIPSRTLTLTGWFVENSVEADQGQEILREYSPDGANANTDLGFLYLRDGSNGFAQMVQVGGGEESANAEGGLQPTSFTLAPQDSAVVATGITIGS